MLMISRRMLYRLYLNGSLIKRLFKRFMRAHGPFCFLDQEYYLSRSLAYFIRWISFFGELEEFSYVTV